MTQTSWSHPNYSLVKDNEKAHVAVISRGDAELSLYLH